MIMSTTENGIDTRKAGTSNSSKKIRNNKHLTNQIQMIDEFLDMVEDVEVDCNEPQDIIDDSFDIEHYCYYEDNIHCTTAIDEEIVLEIIANDDRLNREVEEFMQSYSMTIDEDEEDLFGAMDSIFMPATGPEPPRQ
jgi:hypothetical protein